MAVQKFSCSTCSIDVNSAVQLEQHLSSRRHLDKVSGNVPAITTKNRFESYSTAEVAQPYSQKKFVKRVNRKVVSSRNQNQRFNPYSEESTFQQEIPTGAADGQFSCSVCNINLNSAIQLQQHEASKKHAEKAAGFSSHNNMVEKMKTPNVISSSTSQGSGQTYAFADLRQKRPPLKATSSSMSKESDQSCLFADLRERPPFKGAATKSNRGGGSGVGVKNFTCETCNVITNSMVQLQQHYQSLKHIEQIEGKSTSKKEPSFGIPPQTFIKKNTFKNGIIAKKPRGSKSGFTGQNKFSSPSLRQPPDFEPPQQQDFVAPQKPFVASQNQFSSPTVRQISDFVPPQKSDFQSQNNFNSPTMFQTPPPGFLPPQQPVLNRMLNNMKSNSDQDQSAKLFSRF